LSGRYGTAELRDVPEMEFHLSANGAMSVTGFPGDEVLGLVAGR
jgi:hypothetical protein